MSKNKKIVSIGGQAVLEGVMMKGPFKTATAIRTSENQIECLVENNGNKDKHKFLRLPIVRGCVNFVDSMVNGMRALMASAEYLDVEEEEQESKLDRWLKKRMGDKYKNITLYITVLLSVLLSICLFILVPTVIAQFLQWGLRKTGLIVFVDTGLFVSSIEGIVKMAIFLLYIYGVSKMKEIRRVYEYHGAEHKTISCYEAGEELTVENVKKHTRFHPRCGTSFLFLVMMISIIVYAFLPTFAGYGKIQQLLLRMGTRILFLPLVSGISYEFIKLAGRSNNRFVKLFSKPGLWLQHLTTREPDKSQIEVAIAAVKAVIPEEDDENNTICYE